MAVINARFIKPLDDELITKYCQPFARIITVEDNYSGGLDAEIAAGRR